MPRPKLNPHDLRVPLNCTITPETKELVTSVQNRTNESQGEIIDRAVALLANGEQLVVRHRKPSKAERIAEARAKSDLTGQTMEREDVDYSDVESEPYTHVVEDAKERERYNAQMRQWRESRRPLLKPKDR